MNAARVLLPAAESAGARIITGARVERIRHRLGKVTGVVGHTRAGDSFSVRAKAVVLAASATGSPALVLASGLGDAYRQAGAGLHLHPGGSVAALFPEEVRGWEGVPQSWECTEFLDPLDPGRRTWLLPVFAHPVATAAMLPGFGLEHRARMSGYGRMAACSAMLHDHGSGRVGATRDGRPRIHYTLDPEDARALAQGLAACAKILLAAGAEEVFLPFADAPVVRDLGSAEAASTRQVRRMDPPLAAVHPMGGLRMGSDPRRSAVDERGRYHGARGLWVADGSLMPSSTGGPPQLTIYALGRIVGRHCAEELGGRPV
jgi:choline dehydrogenase-like flavoprotein